MRPALIIKTGSKLPSIDDVAGDYEDWIARGLGWPAMQVAGVAAGAVLPPPHALALAVITGSGAMVTDDDDWIERTAAWLRAAVGAGLPVLGICFGHQLLAQALGGDVNDNPRGLEVGTTTVNLTPAGRTDPLFHNLPAAFPAQVSHRQSVLRPPRGARILAYSTLEPIQAFAYGDRAWGIQFHPEFDAAVIRHYVEHFRQRLRREGGDADRTLAAITAGDASTTLLRRFAQLATSHDNEDSHAR